jgi:hypothetical protein
MPAPLCNSLGLYTQLLRQRDYLVLLYNALLMECYIFVELMLLDSASKKGIPMQNLETFMINKKNQQNIYCQQLTASRDPIKLLIFLGTVLYVISTL